MKCKLCLNLFAVVLCSTLILSTSQLAAHCSISKYKGYNLCAHRSWSLKCGDAWSYFYKADVRGVLWSIKPCSAINAENATDFLVCNVYFYPDMHPNCIFGHKLSSETENPPALED